MKTEDFFSYQGWSRVLTSTDWMQNSTKNVLRTRVRQGY